MKKYHFYMILFLSLVIFSIIISAGIQNNAKINKGLADEVRNGKEVRVYIKFKAGEYSLGKKINALDGIKVRRDFGDVVSASINENDLKKLESNQDIEEIGLDGVKHPFLQNSTVLINATRTWNLQQNTLNLTGRGQAICIVDTGVNYTHPDFGGCYGNNTNFNCKVVGGHDFTNNDNDPMDDYDHGTHVAGIAAANGSINGAAKEARIVALKVCDNAGTCADSDIRPAIDWCVTNSSMFNISVISISLGGAINYTSYCDGQDDPFGLTGAINRAAAKNISVVVASGNSYNNSAISSPACVQNATPVGSTTKLDAISTFSNRYQLMNLLAPGGTSGGSASCTGTTTTPNFICSTYLSGGYIGFSGTSMAAPHVSGAIAIMRQYLSLTSQTKTSKEIETALNNTGKSIADTTGINYSRIDVYKAVISLDNQNPNVTLSGMNLTTNRINQTFSCNATDLSLKNATFYLWNSTDVYNQTFQTISGSSNNFEVNVSNIAFGGYNWNCQFYDENNNAAFALNNLTLTISSVIVNLVSPSNNLTTNLNQTFSCNASSNSSLKNATFYLWNSTALENTSSFLVSGTSNVTNFSYGFRHEDNYNWNCLYYNSLNYSNYASLNYSLTYDITKPILTIISPINNSWYNRGIFNVSLNEQGNCSYSVNNELNISMNKSSLNFTSINSSLSDGNYNVTFYCNDSAGNMNSSLLLFSIDLTLPVVNLSEPYPSDETASSTTRTFYYNSSDNLNITRCDLIFNNVNVSTNSSVVSQTNNITYSFSSGTYNWNVNCTDQTGNVGNSSSRILTISAPSASSGGGGGEGSISTANTYSISNEQLLNGYSKEIGKGDKISFNLVENHTLKLNSIGNDYANITLSSKEVNLLLGSGQSTKLNLTNKDYYDLLIKLDSIFNGKVNITLREINESMNMVSIDNGQTNAFKNTANDKLIKDSLIKQRIYFFAIEIILIIAIIIYAIYIYYKTPARKEVSRNRILRKAGKKLR